MLSLVVLALVTTHPVLPGARVPSPITQAPVTQPAPATPEQPWPPAGVFRPGPGVTFPKITKDVRPSYTADAMRERVQGGVMLEAIVLTDGTVGEVRVVRSLDKRYGLDDAAASALKQWQFTPGQKDGIAVPVLVEVEMTFSTGKPRK